MAIAGVLALLCAQAAVLAVLAGFGARPVEAVIGVFLVVAAFEAAGALPRAGILAGHAAAAARRVIEAADEPARVIEPRFSLRRSPVRPDAFEACISAGATARPCWTP